MTLSLFADFNGFSNPNTRESRAFSLATPVQCLISKFEYFIMGTTRQSQEVTKAILARWHQFFNSCRLLE